MEVAHLRFPACRDGMHDACIKVHERLIKYICSCMCHNRKED